MSRTVRRLSLDGGNGIKWYNHKFYSKDYNVLKTLPKLKDQNRGHWVWEFGHRKYDGPEPAPWRPGTIYRGYYRSWKFETVDKEEFYRDKARFSRPRPPSEYEPNPYGLIYDAPMIEKWGNPGEYYTSKNWVPNPEFDSDAHDEYKNWLRVHSEVYRNGSCRRQRMHGVALSKKIDHRQKRARAKQSLHKELREYYDDTLNS